MSYQKNANPGQSFQAIRDAFLQADGLPFSDVLSEEQIERAFEEEDAQCGQQDDDVYTPGLTLWTFLSQVVHAGAQRSCNAAVERLRTLCLALGIRAPSPDSGAYCRARSKLSEAVLQRLTYEVADGLETQAPEEWLWCGRHVKVVDGSTLMLPDTPENQAEWPQMAAQLPGLGFPILRFVMLFSLATAAVCGFAETPYEGKETGGREPDRRRGDGAGECCGWFHTGQVGGSEAGIDRQPSGRPPSRPCGAARSSVGPRGTNC